MASIFVYGTLMSPQVVRILLGRTVVPSPAILSGYQRYPVVDQAFPGMIPNNSGMTEGMILEELSAIDVQVLDWFEGDEYVRRSVTCVQNGVDRQVDTYVWSNPVSQLELEQEWDYQRFCENKLEWYLSTTVRPCRMEMDELGIGTTKS